MPWRSGELTMVCWGAERVQAALETARLYQRPLFARSLPPLLYRDEVVNKRCRRRTLVVIFVEFTMPCSILGSVT